MNLLAVEYETHRVSVVPALINYGVLDSGIVPTVRVRLSQTSIPVEVFSKSEPEPSLSGPAMSAASLRELTFDYVARFGRFPR